MALFDTRQKNTTTGYVRILYHWNGPKLLQYPNLKPIHLHCKHVHKKQNIDIHIIPVAIVTTRNFSKLGALGALGAPVSQRLFIASNWCSCISASRWSAAEKPWTTRYLRKRPSWAEWTEWSMEDSTAEHEDFGWDLNVGLEWNSSLDLGWVWWVWGTIVGFVGATVQIS